MRLDEVGPMHTEHTLSRNGEPLHSTPAGPQ